MAIVPLFERLTDAPRDPDSLLELFLGWVADKGVTLYPAQEEAVLEIMAGRHVILNTPTGSGKSLVAVAMHFQAFAHGQRSVYTSPIKALVSEKFFELCDQFGAENVGLLTGDASINHEAKVICCTAEILAAMSLTEGDAAGVDYAILDEFHYYGDRDRGVAWQLPLLTLTKTTFLLMSATLGDTTEIRKNIEARTKRPVALVRSVTRPVPLDYVYAEDPLHEVLSEHLRAKKAPVYIVNFTQRGAAELVQSLTSINVCDKAEKDAIAAELKGFRFDTPYGKDVNRYLRHGLGIHHAGLLPKYRLLVERLTQKGLLKVISGTDTLGVGINVPLRTVLFTQLCKFDGEKTRLLTVRDFKQIAGRAGRKGFDTQGSVVCMAPEHLIENKKMERSAAGDAKKLRKMVKKRPPEKGYAHWDEQTFNRMIEAEPEELTSRFKVDQSMLLGLLQRPEKVQTAKGGYGELLDLIDRCHERPGRKAYLKREAVQLFRSLKEAGVISLVPRPGRPRGRRVELDPELQHNFSMHHPLDFFLLNALEALDQTTTEYALKVMTLVESVLEDPAVILHRQRDRAVRERLAELKAEGVEYEARLLELEKVTWPMPDADDLFWAYDQYMRTHPWLKAGAVAPKSIAREMYERFWSFNEYVKELGLEASEGILLRHLSQAYKTLIQTVPESFRTDAVDDMIAWLRAELARVDSSLVQAWELLVTGMPAQPTDTATPRPVDIRNNVRAFAARVRTEVHRLVKALSTKDFEEAVLCLRGDEWTVERLVDELAPYFEEYDRVLFNHHAREPGFTRVDTLGTYRWRVRQVLCDPNGDEMWYLEGLIDLSDGVPEGPMIQLERIST